MEPFALVTGIGEVRENIIRFNSDLQQAAAVDDKDFISYLSQYKHWYYLPDVDLMGPSKYIGYVGMTAERYVNKHGYHADGRDTDRQLKELGFMRTEAPELMDALSELLYPFGKKPNVKAGVFTLK